MTEQDDELALPSTCKLCGKPLGEVSVDDLCPDCCEEMGISVPVAPEEEVEPDEWNLFIEELDGDERSIFIDDPGELEDEEENIWMTEIEIEFWKQRRPANYDEYLGQM